jgi:hypothetical protein
LKYQGYSHYKGELEQKGEKKETTSTQIISLMHENELLHRYKGQVATEIIGIEKEFKVAHQTGQLKQSNFFLKKGVYSSYLVLFQKYLTECTKCNGLGFRTYKRQ